MLLHSNLLKFLADLQALPTESTIGCASQRDDISDDQMQYHSFSLPNGYSAVVSVSSAALRQSAVEVCPSASSANTKLNSLLFLIGHLVLLGQR